MYIKKIAPRAQIYDTHPHKLDNQHNPGGKPS